MPPILRLPNRIQLILWFTLISAVVGAFYAHMLAVMDGSPLFTHVDFQ